MFRQHPRYSKMNAVLCFEYGSSTSTIAIIFDWLLHFVNCIYTVSFTYKLSYSSLMLTRSKLPSPSRRLQSRLIHICASMFSLSDLIPTGQTENVLYGPQIKTNDSPLLTLPWLSSTLRGTDSILILVTKSLWSASGNLSNLPVNHS